MSAIKEQCVAGKGPKEVVSKVAAAVGGVRNALDACELKLYDLKSENPPRALHMVPYNGKIWR